MAAPTTKHKVSKPAAMLWDRMGDWYGTRLGEMYGPVPPVDWCMVIDLATPAACELAMQRMRKQHPVYPPTFPQFEQLFQLPPPREQPPSVQERLRSYVFATRELTAFQRMRLNWLYRGKAWSEEGAEITGVVIPADGDIAGGVIRLAELERYEAAKEPA